MPSPPLGGEGQGEEVAHGIDARAPSSPRPSSHGRRGIREAAEGNARTDAPYSPAGVPPREVPSSSITSLSWISPSM